MSEYVDCGLPAFGFLCHRRKGHEGAHMPDSSAADRASVYPAGHVVVDRTDEATGERLVSLVPVGEQVVIEVADVAAMFGLTEADLDTPELDAAEARAKQEYAEYVEYIKALQARMERELSEHLFRPRDDDDADVLPETESSMAAMRVLDEVMER